ncbi:solute carrier family 35 member G2-like [Branchiostoma floridae x Branchiostoma japonicum]
MTTGGDNDELDELFQDRNSENTEKDTNCCLWLKNHSGVAACLASGLFIGIVPATSRYIQDSGYTAFQINFFNDLLLFIAVLCVVAYQRKSLLPTNCGQVFRLVFQGVGRFVGTLCQIQAYRYAPPATAETIINPSTIVFVVILSCIFIKEMPTCATIFGSLWCMAGIVLLGYSSITNKDTSTQDTDDVVLGTVLAIAAGLLFAMLSVNIKILLESTSKTMVLTYAYSTATVLSGVATIFTTKTWYLEPTTAGLLFANCVSRCTSIVLMYVGLKHVEVNAAMALFQVDAFSAFGLQWAILGIAPTMFDGFGLACILIGTISIAIWEGLVLWIEDKHSKLIKQLEFNATLPYDDM